MLPRDGICKLCPGLRVVKEEPASRCKTEVGLSASIASNIPRFHNFKSREWHYFCPRKRAPSVGLMSEIDFCALSKTIHSRSGGRLSIDRGW
jgi:hypothetical protein